MKKLIVPALFVLLLSIFTGCATTNTSSTASIQQLESYYSSSDSDCDFIFEITNQSEKPLTFSNRIFDARQGHRSKAIIKGADEIIAPGETKVYKYNSLKLIRDFDSSLSVGVHCYEKKWYWWYPISGTMHNQQLKVVVTDATKTGGSTINSYYYQSSYKIPKFQNSSPEKLVIDFSIDDYKKNETKKILFSFSFCYTGPPAAYI